MRILLINDTSKQSNWGCRATSFQLRRMLAAGGHEIVESVLVTELSHPHGWRLPLGCLFRKPITLFDCVPARLSQFPTYANRVLRGQATLKGPESTRVLNLRQALEQCDLVFINGEGSIHGNRRVAKAILFVAYVAKTVFGKPCVLTNHTADLGNPELLPIAEAVYPMLDDVSFRDPISERTWGHLARQVTGSLLIPDAAFCFQPLAEAEFRQLASRPTYFSVWPDSAEGFDPRTPYVCVSASSIYYREETYHYDPVPGYLRLCDRLRTQVGQVVLTAPCHVDERILRQVSRKLNLPLIGRSAPTQQAVDILGNAQLHISGRWHPTIFAAVGGAPAITLTANTYKLNGLNELLGLSTPTFDALALERQVDDIVDLAAVYFRQGPTDRTARRNLAAGLAERAAHHSRWLRQGKATQKAVSHSLKAG
ncbi:MAG: polysaccharide pyruvyl transferase family protein [Planctomycetia bacterium]|nr:polysaccharide pyruvyl transferase family protein [Planctomycetia bacterium]